MLLNAAEACPRCNRTSSPGGTSRRSGSSLPRRIPGLSQGTRAPPEQFRVPRRDVPVNKAASCETPALLAPARPQARRLSCSRPTLSSCPLSMHDIFLLPQYSISSFISVETAVFTPSPSESEYSIGYSTTILPPILAMQLFLSPCFRPARDGQQLSCHSCQKTSMPPCSALCLMRASSLK